MLYLVHMVVNLPPDMHPDSAAELRQREADISRKLQQAGTWRHLWRVAGQYANYSVFDVGSHDELHDIVSNLPLFPYLEVKVIPLAAHPSAIEQQS